MSYSCASRLLLLTLLAAPTLAQSGTSSTQADGVTSATEPSLPKTGTVYVQDGTLGSRPLMQLHATEVVSNSHAAGNFARNQVFIGGRATVELPGLNAAVHLSTSSPVLYVRISSDDPELVRKRVHLVRLDQSSERRVVITYSQNIFGGQRAKKYKDIPIETADAEPDVWMKITPAAPLTAGEYGIVFMPKDVNLAPDAVYDFDVQFEAAKPTSH